MRKRTARDAIAGAPRAPARGLSRPAAPGSVETPMRFRRNASRSPEGLFDLGQTEQRETGLLGRFISLASPWRPKCA